MRSAMPLRSVKPISLLFAAVVLLLTASPAHADPFSFSVNLDTSRFSNVFQPPFFLNFQLTDGDGVNNNGVLITNFMFGGGGPVDGPFTMGGVTGSLWGVVSLTDTQFLNDFLQEATLGQQLSFDLTMTTNFAGGTPDEFTFAVLDRNFSEIPTTDPTGTDVLLRVVINSDNPYIDTFQAVVPEPSSILLLGTGLVTIVAGGRRKVVRLRRSHP